MPAVTYVDCPDCADIPRLIMTEPTGDIIQAFGVLAGVLATTATPEQIRAMRAGGSPLAARVADAAAEWHPSITSHSQTEHPHD